MPTSKMTQVPVKRDAVNLLPLLAVVLCVFALRLYLALTDPVLRAIDPWWWAPKIESYAQGLTIERIYEPLAPGGWGPIVYPRGYPVLSALIALASGASGYEAVRFYPVISALNLIPMYFLSFFISKSRRVATATIILVTISKWYSIRTSIAGAECFTHFWLVLSLLFLLRMRDQTTWRNTVISSVFVTATVLFWHYPIAIYALLFPLLGIVSLRDRLYCRRLLAVALMSALAAGFLWYFWVPLSGWGLLARSLGLSSSVAAVTPPPDLVGSWGYVLLALGSAGFVYVLSRRSSKQDTAKAFLVTYFFSILALTALSTRLGWLGLYYGFSSLTLPLAIFAAIGLIAAVDAVTPSLETWTATTGPSNWMKGRWSRVLAMLFILLVVLANSSPANYGGATFYRGWYEAVFSDQILESDLQGAIDNGQGLIVTFRYGKAFDAPSSELYSALSWIRDHSTTEACVSAFLLRPPPSTLCPSPSKPCPYSVLQDAFQTISERRLIEAAELENLLVDPPEELRDRISSTCSGGVYIVIGIRSWSGEQLADVQLESALLSHAAQAPTVLPEEYSVREVRVFHLTCEMTSITENPSSQLRSSASSMILLMRSRCFAY